MCRCNKNTQSPYCNDCGTLIPRKAIYREGTSLVDILKDGWSRGFEPWQTKAEAQAKGYILTVGEVEIAFMIYEDMMIKELEDS